MNITVYLGANKTEDPHIRKAAEELGVWIAANGHTLVYGGSKSGLMGTLAFAVVENGGTETMAERKQKMIKMGDAFIAFPGGTGTLEEISEVMSMVSLGLLGTPCMLYDIDGYYEGLRTQLEKMKEMGLSSDSRQAGIYFVSSLEEIAEIVAQAE